MPHHSTKDISSTKSSGSRRTHKDARKSKSPRTPARDRSTNAESDRSTGRRSSKRNFRMLCVRNFSANLNVETVQNRLFREFSRFGNISVTVGYLDEELAGLIVFEHEGDAYEAYCDVKHVRFNDRTYPVEIVPDEATNKKDSETVRSSHTFNETQFSSKSSSSMQDNNRIETGTSSIPSTSTALTTALKMAGSSMRSLLSTPSDHYRHQESRARSPGSSPPSMDDDSSMNATRTLFVGHLEPDINESELTKAFAPFGIIDQVDVKRPARTGAHAYAFVRYANVDMAFRAKSAMAGKRIRSAHCKIGYGKPLTTKYLFISKGSSQTCRDLSGSLLSSLNQVVSYDWSTDQSNVTVTFHTVDAAVHGHSLLKQLIFNDPQKMGMLVDYVEPSGASESVGRFPQQSADDKLCSRGSRNTREEQLASEENGATRKLQTVVKLWDLDRLLQPDLFSGTVKLKRNGFHFRCLHVSGDSSLGAKISESVEHGKRPVLKITQRAKLNPSWMAEATYLFQSAVSEHQGRLSLMLLLPDYTPALETLPNSDGLVFYPFSVLIAYLKLKQSLAFATLENGREKSPGSLLLLNLFAPSSFSLSLLKQTAPKLTSELATADSYVLLLALNP